MWFQFFVNIKQTNKERCVFKLFRETNNKEKELLKHLRFTTIIFIKKDDEINLENGQMIFNYDEDTDDDIQDDMMFLGKISPLMNYGSYKFYIDEEDGNIKEKI
ncbi:hypothetical protein ACQ4LE_004887 [Meloidogyne hapla]|uniref:Ubiquitin-like domain-containing protein n=1 Tax=Meloidogyne hapla TaxID=6305 RepID=A0A1I8BNP5_MELHA